MKNMDREYLKQGITLNEYTSIHVYLKNNYTKTGVCSLCLKSGHKRTEWALIKGKLYSRDINNYKEMCSSCHRKYDLTDSIKEKISKAMKRHVIKNGVYKLPVFNRYNHPKNRKVAKINPKTGEIIKIYESVTIASMEMKGKITGAIQNNIKGLSKTAYKFKWRYI